jgi:hypothetical protein
MICLASTDTDWFYAVANADRLKDEFFRLSLSARASANVARLL